VITCPPRLIRTVLIRRNAFFLSCVAWPVHRHVPAFFHVLGVLLAQLHPFHFTCIILSSPTGFSLSFVYSFFLLRSHRCGATYDATNPWRHQPHNLICVLRTNHMGHTSPLAATMFIVPIRTRAAERSFSVFVSVSVAATLAPSGVWGLLFLLAFPCIPGLPPAFARLHRGALDAFGVVYAPGTQFPIRCLAAIETCRGTSEVSPRRCSALLCFGTYVLGTRVFFGSRFVWSSEVLRTVDADFTHPPQFFPWPA
jgi:hypothetical protein